MNQNIDFILKGVDDGGLIGKLKREFRRVLFESGVFLMKESSERTVGVYTEHEGCGSMIYEEDEEWIINFGMGDMGLLEIDKMLCHFDPMEKLLGEFKGDTGISLAYVLENREKGEEGKDPFLKEIVLTPPAGLVDGALPRVFKVRNVGGNIIFTFKSINKGLLSIKESATFLQQEKANAEEVFISSLFSWLNSLKPPEAVLNQKIAGTNCSRLVLNNKSTH